MLYKFEENTQKLLVYASTSLSKTEIHFWNRTRESLLKLNLEFLLMGTSTNKEAENNLCMPYLYMPPILSSYTNIYTSFPEEDVDNIAELLEIEEKWFGKGSIELRKSGARYIHNLYIELITSLKPKSCIIWNGELPTQIILKNICNKISCPVVFIERGPLPDTMQLSKLGFNGGFNGSHPIANKTNWEWPDAQTQKRSHSLYLSYKKLYKDCSFTWHPQPSSNNKYISIPKNKKVILFFNQLDEDTSNFYFSPFFKKNIDALKWLCEQLKARNDIYIIAKQHPCNHDKTDAYERIIKKQGIWTNSLSLKSCLNLADYVVGVNSSSLFESLVLDKAVLQLGKSLLSNKNIVYEYNHNDQNVISNWLDKVDLETKLKNWSDFASYLFYDQMYLTNENCEDYESFRNINDISIYLNDTSQNHNEIYEKFFPKIKIDLQYIANMHEYINLITPRRLRYGSGSLMRRIIYCLPYPRRMLKAIRYWAEDRSNTYKY
ncbi:MAG: hypothetical protein KGZ88_07205 [Methylomicrobium sp.]|nr:hypothetical protein [Methylomicrobium sp.]